MARSKDIGAGKTLGVSFAGEPIVLVRAESGNVFALEDRCAHRQVPLHVGVVRGECVQCCYHGWTYDNTGKCVDVPYLDKERSLPTGVRSYPCREAYDLVFVYTGEMSRLSEATFPDLSRHEDPHYKTRFLNRRVQCHYSFMHENLMDMNHQFLHRGIMRRIRTTPLDLRSGPNWVEVHYTFARTGGRDPLGEKFMIGKRQASSGGRERDLMTIRTDYPYQRLMFWRAGSEHPALDLWNVYVPVDRAQRVNHTFGLMMIRRPSIRFLINAFWPVIGWFTNGIFNEDQWIVEEEQKAFERQGADWNNEIFAPIMRLRELLISQGIPLSEPQSG